MKKALLTTAVIIFALTVLVSCTGKGEQQKEIEGTLYEIMHKIYETVGTDFAVIEVDVTPDNAEYYLGTSGIEYKEALASEPMISAIAHSVVLVRLDPDADIEAVKEKIRDNADPRKWVCVGVDEDKVVVESIGSLILFVMDNESELYSDAFQALAQ